MAAAFFAVALVFVAFLVIGLIVAAIMGLATIMPAWLAALLVCAVFLLIALIGGLIGLRKFKKAMPLMPEETIRGIKHDLGIAKEGSDFNAAMLDPQRPEAKAAKAAKDEAAAKAKAEKEAKAAEHDKVSCPHASEPELHRRLDQRRAAPRRESVTSSERSWTSSPRPRPCWARPRQGWTRARQARATARTRPAKSSQRSPITGLLPVEAAGSLPGSGAWKPLLAFAASTAVLLVLLRKLLQERVLP